jgi:hypothetical protein
MKEKSEIRKYKYMVILILLIISSVVSNSQVQYEQEPLKQQIGIYSTFNFNLHTTNIDSLPDVPNCCKQFRNGQGTGFTIGLLANFPLSKRFSIQFVGNYTSLNGTLKETEYEPIVINRVITQAEIEHKIESKFAIISFEPSINFRTFDKLFFFLGPNISYLLQKDFSQVETLMKPENTGTFENGKRTRNERSGQINNTNSILGFLNSGLYYDFPLNEIGSMLLSPIFQYHFDINSFLKSDSWKVQYFSLGLTIKYSPPGLYSSSPLKPRDE